MHLELFPFATLASAACAQFGPPHSMSATGSISVTSSLAHPHGIGFVSLAELPTCIQPSSIRALPGVGDPPSASRSASRHKPSSPAPSDTLRYSLKPPSSSEISPLALPTLLISSTPLQVPSSPNEFNFTGEAWGRGDKQLMPPTSHFSHFDCGTHAGTASDHFLNTVHDLYRSAEHASIVSLSGSHARRSVQRRATTVNVPVYVHVVTTQANSGTITPAMVANQLAAMNGAYRSHGFTFTLQGSDITVNDAWAVGASPGDDLAMKTALRSGTYSTLNLYMQTDLAGGILGRCTLPTDVGSSPTASTYVLDGCNVAAGTMPGGVIGGFNMGMTAVHETGHWLGLLHTFEGYSCTGSGDFVADTPSEAESTSGCPSKPWKNSCSNRSGYDPIHNYMDYSTDACYIRFTPGQEQRMKSLWPTYRAGR